MKKFTTHEEVKNRFFKDPEFHAAYEAEFQNPGPDYQIVYHHEDGTEEIVFDSRSQNGQN
ncbi:hypothetical protein Xmau_01052 [Xenorhabdus mauleonii]|uniref:Uncharacterized protein n=1 Tax=Xenorhabdus mauleonii TaxID=351675 RepID=A0A1I3M564_9GAMM|nr:hypothetical protein [Xenorhabdus mauleonii]PHM45402.1 hypothetical protein Xmau_01052 [Xenorhabdus mauleonii]SFI92098.1 hypothetical protein SAMN05421680_104169 [Xenorhabdus mauleonii]